MKNNRPFSERLADAPFAKKKTRPTLRITYGSKSGKLTKTEKKLG